MSGITSASINTLPSERQAGFESPSEQLIVLTYSQLQDLIVQAVQEAIQPLQDEIAQNHQEIAALRLKMASLETLQEQDTNRICVDIAYDRRRLTALEHPAKEPGKTDLSRAEKIERYLAARPDHKATFETLKGHLGIDKVLLNQAVKALMASSPGRYGITRTPGDKRKRTLIMLPK
jgi:hypothetical protein